MSRIKLPASDVKIPSYDVFVGWDNALESYFGQVYDMAIVDEDEMLIFWIGADQVKEIFDITDLVNRMERYCSINNDIRAQLLRDYSNRTEPTPLQRRGRELLN